MAIYTALLIFLPLTILAGAFEGIMALVDKARERREWKHLYSYYYPNGKARRI